jgi:hypothetical protein
MKIAHANGSILTVKLNFGPSLSEGQVNHSRLESMVQEMSEFLIGAKPSNIQIQKTGAMTPCHPGGPMPASDLERWIDINKGCVGSHRCSLG